jgi:hypothetical protein
MRRRRQRCGKLRLRQVLVRAVGRWAWSCGGPLRSSGSEGLEREWSKRRERAQGVADPCFCKGSSAKEEKSPSRVRASLLGTSPLRSARKSSEDWGRDCARRSRLEGDGCAHLASDGAGPTHRHRQEKRGWGGGAGEQAAGAAAAAAAGPDDDRGAGRGAAGQGRRRGPCARRPPARDRRRPRAEHRSCLLSRPTKKVGGLALLALSLFGWGRDGGATSLGLTAIGGGQERGNGGRAVGAGGGGRR